MCIKSKFCRICSVAKQKGRQARVHNCRVNHWDSSGAMESDALLDMIHKLHSKWHVHLQHLCTDDDSTMRARLRWNNEDHKLHFGTYPMHQVKRGKDIGKWKRRQCTGKLQHPIPQPKFVADPSHRKKTLQNKLCSFNTLPASQKYGFGPADITRIVKNFLYFVNALKTIDHDEWHERAKCALDHHFDDHSHCGSFCLRKDELLEKSAEENAKKFYRSKVKDKKMYEALSEIVQTFITKTRLDEVGPGMDAQPNESINNTIAWKATKGKTYCGSVSLENRVCVALSTHLIGPDKHFRGAFGRMGIHTRPGTAHHLKLQAKRLTTKGTNQKKLEVKRKQNHKNFEKLKEQLVKLMADNSKSNVHMPGVAMATDGAIQIETDNAQEKKCRCGSSTHLRTSSSKCKWNKKNEAERDEAKQQALLDNVQVEDDMNKLETENTLIQIEESEEDGEDCDYEDLFDTNEE